MISIFMGVLIDLLVLPGGPLAETFTRLFTGACIAAPLLAILIGRTVSLAKDAIQIVLLGAFALLSAQLGARVELAIDPLAVLEVRLRGKRAHR